MTEATISVQNPVTGEMVGTVPNLTPEQVREVVERARAAQPAWEARGNRGRARLVRLWGEELWRERQPMMRTIRSESGKNEVGALLEMTVLDVVIDYYAHYAPKLLRPEKRRPLFPLLQYATIFYKPYGVTGFLTPWNYPYLNGLMDVVPALVAGKTVVIKASEITPFTVLQAVQIAHRVGIPQDVIQVVPGDGQTGSALVDTVDCIHLTGSTGTGRKVAQRAAERLIPYSLELGGKDPLIVLEDADIELAAVSTLRSALENSGQVCVSTERVYVVEAVYDQFVRYLCEYAPKLVIGPGDGLDIHIGSMTNEREIIRCEQQIKDAERKGAHIIFGGKRRPDLGPLFFEPTILIDVDHTMEIMREETFGPLVPVMRVKNSEEAIRLANDSRFGLSGAVFTHDLKMGERVARRINSGDISVNRTQIGVATPSIPSGGQKESGVGRRGGREGLMRFVAPQTVVVDRMWMNKPILTLLDPMQWRLFRLSRVLRRFLPFVRPGV